MSGTSGSSGLGSFNKEQIDSRTSEETSVNVSTFREYPFEKHPHQPLGRENRKLTPFPYKAKSCCKQDTAKLWVGGGGGS